MGVFTVERLGYRHGVRVRSVARFIVAKVAGNGNFGAWAGVEQSRCPVETIWEVVETERTGIA